MHQRLRLIGDLIHVAAIMVFIIVVGVKGNASGLSLKSQQLYLAVFLLRYMDLFYTYYSFYNTAMKSFFILSTAGTIYMIMKKEPARSTYSAAMDCCPIQGIIITAVLSSMIIHLIGSGAVDVKGSSGQEFEVHFEHLSFLSWFWTCSIVLEPLAMIPQLYIFRKHRLIHRDIRFGIFLMGIYRVFYVLYWIFRARKQNFFQHHYLLYITGSIQVLTYMDFFFYHWSVGMLWFLTKCGACMGDSSSLIEDSGIEAWALTATGDDEYDDEEYNGKQQQRRSGEDEQGWQPGDSPAKASIEMKRAAGMGVV